MPRPPSSTLFPYTTLFRSAHVDAAAGGPEPEVLRPPDQRVRCGLVALPQERDDLGRQVLHVVVEQHDRGRDRSEEHTSELQSLRHLVCRLLLEKKKKSSKS